MSEAFDLWFHQQVISDRLYSDDEEPARAGWEGRDAAPVDEPTLDALADRCAAHANKQNDNEWSGEAEVIANYAAVTAAYEAFDLAIAKAADLCDERAKFADVEGADELREAARQIRALNTKDSCARKIVAERTV
jgi:hypothetical protein